MRINLAQNLRELRKQKKMTQEELAERLHVSVGVISKWERGASEPELGIVVDIATIFGISVDVLIGYEIMYETPGMIADRISELKKQAKLTEAMELARQALMKYPNDLKIVYNSANLFFISSFSGEGEYTEEALSLFNRALMLLPQDRQTDISEADIFRYIATCYGNLERYDDAIKLLKEHNISGMNDDLIGLILVNEKKDYQEGIKYLNRATSTILEKFIRVCFGFYNFYCENKKLDQTIQTCDFFAGVSKLVLVDKSKANYLIKLTAVMQAGTGVLCLDFGHEDKCRRYLRSALQNARFYDSCPVITGQNMIFLNEERDKAAVFDSMPQSAFDAVEKTLASATNGDLMRIWKEVVNEEKKNDVQDFNKGVL